MKVRRPKPRRNSRVRNALHASPREPQHPTEILTRDEAVGMLREVDRAHERGDPGLLDEPTFQTRLSYRVLTRKLEPLGGDTWDEVLDRSHGSKPGIAMAIELTLRDREITPRTRRAMVRIGRVVVDAAARRHPRVLSKLEPEIAALDAAEEHVTHSSLDLLESARESLIGRELEYCAALRQGTARVGDYLVHHIRKVAQAAVSTCEHSTLFWCAMFAEQALRVIAGAPPMNTNRSGPNAFRILDLQSSRLIAAAIRFEVPYPASGAPVEAGQS